MHRLFMTGGLWLALGACATPPTQSLARCDGQHRRPANPNGSVLSAPAAAGKPGPAAAADPPPAASFAPCGNRP